MEREERGIRVRKREEGEGEGRVGGKKCGRGGRGRERDEIRRRDEMMRRNGETK